MSRIREIRSQLEASRIPSRRIAPRPCRKKFSGGGAHDAPPPKTVLDPQALREELANSTRTLLHSRGLPAHAGRRRFQSGGDVHLRVDGIRRHMLSDEIQVALSLEKHLGARVIGQDHALQIVSMRIRTSRAGIEDPTKPVGVFIAGPSGVGKTETALAVSELLYGGERNLITINMSEFQEAHTVSTQGLAPPCGLWRGRRFNRGGAAPSLFGGSLDEVEKAHPDVLACSSRCSDKGTIEDGEGRQIDFKNTVIILITNAGTDTITKLYRGSENRSRPQVW